MKGQISYLPGGRSKVLFGGTRNEIKLSRPWQSRLEDLIKPETCPFCTKPQEELPLPEGSPRGWKRLPNMFTPHRNHTLIVPDRCWDAKTLQRWGGENSIAEAISIAAKSIEGIENETVLLIHVGVQGGQNLGHPHLHVLDALIEKPLPDAALLGYANNQAVQVFETEVWIAVAGGTRAGACFVVPKGRMTFSSADNIGSLAQAVSKLIDLGNEKFRSKEGLLPAYGIAIRLGNGTFQYVQYCPTLHNWGVLEYVVAPLEGFPFVLPWPHETTAAHLRG